MKRKRVINIAKIINDKYYTSPELAEYCVKKTEEIIGKENITEYLEPSAGSGVFLDYRVVRKAHSFRGGMDST